MTRVVLKIRTMPNAVSAYRLPSASPLTSSCPHGRSITGVRPSRAQHPHGPFGEVVGDRGLGEPPSRSVPTMDPGAHPEEREGGELGVGPDERAVAHAVADDAFEQVTHRPLLGAH